jgi:hypothetical protein
MVQDRGAALIRHCGSDRIVDLTKPVLQGRWTMISGSRLCGCHLQEFQQRKAHL